MFNYKNLGIISGAITLAGALGPVFQLMFPGIPSVFGLVFLWGILGITISTFFYALHLYEFNSRLLSSFTLSCAIVLLLMSYNFLSYSDLALFYSSGYTGLLDGFIEYLFIFAVSWGALFCADYVRTVVLEDREKPLVTKDLPQVTGAFAISFVVIAFLVGNTLVFPGVSFERSLDAQFTAGNSSGSAMSTGLIGQIQANAPVFDAVKDSIDDQLHPERVQERQDALSESWNDSLMNLKDGYELCYMNSAEIPGMKNIQSPEDRSDICSGIANGTTKFQQSRAVLSSFTSTNFNQLSQMAGAGLLIPSIDKLFSTCQDLNNQCLLANQAIETGDDDSFQFAVRNVSSDLNEMKTDWSTVSAFLGTSS